MSEEEKKYKQLDAVLQLMNTKKDEAGEDDDEETYMHTTLPPYGPLSMWEVMEAAKRCLTLNTYPR
jgi:hypothetical protein